MADSYVCSGAKMICSCGDKVATLVISPDRTVFLAGQPMANISDHASMRNIQCFGKCHTVSFPPTGTATSNNHGKLTPMPCIPGTIYNWLRGKNDYIVKGNPALLNTSTCICQYGGEISIIFDGQHPEEFDEEYINKLLAEEMEGTQNEEEKEIPWLDAAELIPVVGSIIGIVREAKKGNWWMVALNVGFLALDIAGLFSFGATTAASTAAKASVKAGVKVAAKQVAKNAAKQTVENAVASEVIGSSIELYSNIKSK